MKDTIKELTCIKYQKFENEMLCNKLRKNKSLEILDSDDLNNTIEHNDNVKFSKLSYKNKSSTIFVIERSTYKIDPKTHMKTKNFSNEAFHIETNFNTENISLFLKQFDKKKLSDQLNNSKNKIDKLKIKVECADLDQLLNEIETYLKSANYDYDKCQDKIDELERLITERKRSRGRK